MLRGEAAPVYAGWSQRLMHDYSSPRYGLASDAVGMSALAGFDA
jgi:hypothetical protein